MGWGSRELRRAGGDEMEPGVLGLVTEATESFTSAVDQLRAGGPGKGVCYPDS